jgi:putative membrane protein
MAKRPKISTAAHTAESEEDLAVERTVLAMERTLLAWIRTAITMIGFGLTLAQVLTMLTATGQFAAANPHTPKDLGLVLTGLGLFALVGAAIQHWLMLREMVRPHGKRAWSFGLTVSVLLALLTILAQLALLFEV